MKKAGKIALGVVAGLVAAGIIGGYAAYAIRGNIKQIELPTVFSDGLEEKNKSLATGANARIMSANLLVHYPSWGGQPAKPRAKKFVEILNAYQPDVVGLQEVSDEWYCCLGNNLPDGYRFLYPVSTALFVNMTAMIYNSNTLELIDSGKTKFSQGDNPRLRRVVWGVFERKDDGTRFAVTSTHFDLIREGQEAEELAVMKVQTDEMVQLAKELEQKYNCPVFCTGDYNAMENGSINGKYDAPEIYEKLARKLTDAKDMAELQYYGDAQSLDTPTYDHIFLQGDAHIKAYRILSDSYMTDISDHYPIFIDAAVTAEAE